MRGGGHCYEDFVLNDRTYALIDMSLLNEVGFDSGRGSYYAESGATIGELYRTLYRRFGLTLPAGSCLSVGLGGHISGGGFGLLSRRFGLTVDWLTRLDIVTVNGAGRTDFNGVGAGSAAGAASDLFWAHRGGGGGNFGLITRFEFATLPKAPQRASPFCLDRISTAISGALQRTVRCNRLLGRLH